MNRNEMCAFSSILSGKPAERQPTRLRAPTTQICVFVHRTNLKLKDKSLKQTEHQLLAIENTFGMIAK